jgi:hypothetical protein
MKIIAAAIKDNSGKIWSLPPPKRHHHIVELLYDLRIASALDGQGFLLDDGRWISRKAAATLVLKENPNKVLIAPPNLYSEDLW